MEVFKGLYFDKQDFMSTKIGLEQHGRDVIRNKGFWIIRHERSVKVYKVSWIHNRQWFRLTSQPVDGTATKIKVKSIIDHTTQEWKESELHHQLVFAE